MTRRKRFQRGWLLKIGKRRKVWVGRWREDVLLEDGKVGRVQRSLLLGTVAELPTRRDAQARLDEKLLAVNAGSSRPESSVTFRWFAEQQWKPLVFPTFKASTQHGYKAVLVNHVLPAWKEWRLRDIERLAIQQWVAEKFAKETGWQTIRNSWPRHRPGNALSAREEAQVLALMTSAEYRHLWPKQLVPPLADDGRYLASESTMYR